MSTYDETKCCHGLFINLLSVEEGFAFASLQTALMEAESGLIKVGFIPVSCALEGDVAGQHKRFP